MQSMRSLRALLAEACLHVKRHASGLNARTTLLHFFIGLVEGTPLSARVAACGPAPDQKHHMTVLR